MNRHVKIELVTNDNRDRPRADMRVFLDGERLSGAEGTLGGGEPEDNIYYRDWSWVPLALENLAKALGATVSTAQREATEDDEV